MPSKTIQTPNGMMIVDEDFDESSLDIDSMLPEEALPKKEMDPVSPPDRVIINGEEFIGRIKTYSVVENRKTNQKTVKVVLVS